MSRKRKLLAAIAAAAFIAIFPEFTMMAILTLMAPALAWLFASLGLLAFVATACVAVPVGRAFISWREANEAVKPRANVVYLQDRRENPRRAA